ncbi:MAG: hypothetical protein JWQ14_2751 [Adhaeribacter sp.]|nr:hypothetical protein [Adhaeribacter sp.]
MLSQIPQEITDQDLVTSLRQGHPEALGWLYDKYSPVLLGLISRMMRDEETAAVLLQETFVAIWQRKEAFDDSRLSLLSWLILIARDTTMTALKAGKDKLNTNKPAVTNPETTTTHQHTAVKIKESFCNLQPDEKAALDLIYLRGYTCPAAAAELGISIETLKSRLKMAGKHLRAGGAKG